jgi:toxin-antitoxin system PIN domain toxin
MMLVDANLLLYAEDNFSAFNQPAKQWWDAQLSGSETVGLCWPVVNAFVRIGTNSRLLRSPLTLAEAVNRVQSWFDQPCVRLLQPTEHHWEIFQATLHAGRATANLVSDAHLAALAIEHNCLLYSTDTDFARFRGLKWKNPLV